MHHVLDNRKLKIYLEGELNSYNSEEVERQIEEILAVGGFDAIILDVEHLRYISSAGLRIVARLKQKYDDLTLINMSNDVFEIFEMVGFNDMMTIKRK